MPTYECLNETKRNLGRLLSWSIRRTGHRFAEENAPKQETRAPINGSQFKSSVQSLEVYSHEFCVVARTKRF